MIAHMFPARFLHILWIAGAAMPSLFGQSLHPQGLFCGIQGSSATMLAYTVGELAVLQFPGQGAPSVQPGYLPSVTAPRTVSSLGGAPGWEEAFQLFPNPGNGQLTLRRTGDSGPALQVRLLDSQGWLMGKETMTAGQDQIILQMAQAPPGLYLLTITHPSGLHLHTFQYLKF